MILHNIPAELRALPQWVVAGTDKIPLNPRTAQAASVTDPSTWGTFDEARQAGYAHIGFVLSENDPYTIVDLDDPSTITVNGQKIPNPDAEAVATIGARHQATLNAFQTYTELSQSGMGAHIICRGSVPHGMRKGKIEVYSSARYMICTGRVIKNLPITDQSALLEILADELVADEPAEVELRQVESHLSDDELWRMASTAANAEKFLKLWVGDWHGVPEWPSQSEADFALLAMLGFYSPDNEQVRRLFRFSALGKREKAQRDDYLDFALRKIRAKTPTTIDFSTLIATGNLIQNDSLLKTDNQVFETAKAKPSAPPARPEIAVAGEENEEQPVVGESAVAVPEGLVGRLAEYFFATAIRPVPEVALGAAIALTAGVVSRSFNVSGTGLNQYILILAKTGRGKESAASGIDQMLAAVRPQCPTVDEYMGPATFASGQALTRALDKNPCFLSVLGEFGLTLQEMCRPNASPAHLSLKKVLLDVYAKSGHTKMLRASVYSDSEKNTKPVRAPNITLLGESNPERFYEGLDQQIITEGLLPRFSIFEYTGLRADTNPNAFNPPDARLTNEFSSLVSFCMTAAQANTCCPVQQDIVATRLLREFDRFCTNEINSGAQDVAAELWNRGHLKALKLSALLAVGCNPQQPIITKSMAEWAIQLVRKDVEQLYRKFDTGEVGSGDVRLEHDVKRAIEDYLKMKASKRREYGCPEKMAALPLIPIQYLRRRVRNLAGFRTDRRGSNKALSDTLAAMCSGDMLVKLDPLRASTECGSRCDVFAIGNAFNPTK